MVPGGTGTITGVVSTATTAAANRAPAGQVTTSPRPARRSTARSPQAVPNQLLVKFKPGVTPTQAQESNRLAGGAEVKRFARTGVTLVRITSGEPLNAVLARYRSDPRVAYAEPNYLRFLVAAPRTPQAAPNDQYYPDQWHYQNVNLPPAWDVTTGSALVIVAVIDTGILFNHPDLQGVTAGGFDFVDNDSNPQDPLCPAPDDFAHGSHVAGTIAAATNNSIGVAGVNWGGAGRTKIMPLRIFGNIGGQCATTSADIIAAIEYAADHSARVINMSFGGPGFDQAEQDAVTYAYTVGVTLVAAAGNDDLDCSTGYSGGGFYPANYANVIAVAATSRLNAKASYSNFGNCIDLAAPGGDGGTATDWVLSTAGDSTTPTGYFYAAGTSMASPHVAGLAALLISKGVTGPANVQNMMQQTATDLGAAGKDTTFGWGLINAGAALGAPAATNPVRVFSGTLSGNAITRSSDMVSAASNGTYSVTNVQAGTWTVFAWQDTNANGVIDASDMYGSVAGITVVSGGTTAGVNFSIKEVPAGTTPISVSDARSGPAMARTGGGG